jgi:hypothetical protein
LHFFFAGAKEESGRRRLVHEKLCLSHSLHAGEVAMDEVVGVKKETAEATTQHDKSKKIVSLHRRKRNDILINK